MENTVSLIHAQSAAMEDTVSLILYNRVTVACHHDGAGMSRISICVLISDGQSAACYSVLWCCHLADSLQSVCLKYHILKSYIIKC